MVMTFTLFVHHGTPRYFAFKLHFIQLDVFFHNDVKTNNTSSINKSNFKRKLLLQGIPLIYVQRNGLRAVAE